MVKNERIQLFKSFDIEFLILSFLSSVTYLVIFTTLIYLFFKRMNFEFLFRILVNGCSKQIGKHDFIRLNVYGFILFSLIFVQLMTNNIKVSKLLKMILENINIFRNFVFNNRQKK